MTITPEQFNKIALKEDVRKIVQEELTKELTPVKNEILTTLDAMNKTLTKLDTENVAHVSAHNRFQTTLDNHEVRITKVEKVKVAA